MRLIILRHATAGNKRHWSGPDAQRPLDTDGERTAELLAKMGAARKAGGWVNAAPRPPEIRLIAEPT